MHVSLKRRKLTGNQLGRRPEPTTPFSPPPPEKRLEEQTTKPDDVAAYYKSNQQR